MFLALVADAWCLWVGFIVFDARFVFLLFLGIELTVGFLDVLTVLMTISSGILISR